MKKSFKLEPAMAMTARLRLVDGEVAGCNGEAATGDDEATMVRLQAPTARLLPDDGKVATCKVEVGFFAAIVIGFCYRRWRI